MVSVDYLAASDGLATGEIDLAFVPSSLVGERGRGAHLFYERACLVVRRDHPDVRGKMTARLFNRLGHIDVEVALGKTGVGHRDAEQHWRGLGLVRRVETRVPYFTTAAMVAARTDLVAGLPSRAAQVLCRFLPVKSSPRRSCCRPRDVHDGGTEHRQRSRRPIPSEPHQQGRRGYLGAMLFGWALASGHSASRWL